MDDLQQVNVAGWREWVSLPDLGVPYVEAKIDTGSNASSLHTSFIEHYRREGELWVRFSLEPFPDNEHLRVICLAPVKDTVIIQVSDNHEESFFVIESTIKIGDLGTRLDFVLNSNGNMKHVMHLGRNVLKDLNIQVDPKNSYLFGELPENYYENVPLDACQNQISKSSNK